MRQRDMDMERNFTCENYSQCLAEAAKLNQKFFCSECDGNIKNLSLHGNATLKPKKEKGMEKVGRTTQDLAWALFDEMDELRSGGSTPAIANAKATISKAIISIKRLELDVTECGKLIQPVKI